MIVQTTLSSSSEATIFGSEWIKVERYREELEVVPAREPGRLARV